MEQSYQKVKDGKEKKNQTRSTRKARKYSTVYKKKILMRKKDSTEDRERERAIIVSGRRNRNEKCLCFFR